MNTDKNNNKLIWFITVVLSILLIVIGNRICTDGLDVLNYGDSTVKAKVVSLGERVSDAFDAGAMYENTVQYFDAKIISGDMKGQVVTAIQTSDNYTNMNERDVSVGDKIILYQMDDTVTDYEWLFGSYARFDYMLVFGLVFFALLIYFGRIKGLNTIISLSFTCLAVFAVFVPSVLSGFNIYLMTAITCIYTIVMTLLLTNGVSDKSLTTILGCSFGVAVAAVLTVMFDKMMQLTGILDEHTIYLQDIGKDGATINLRALIFAMIVIGAMGAVMDVAMDISSSLHEVYIHAPHLGFKELFNSGIRIGRDVMGTMANTLVLAYIGSSLCSVLLLIFYSSSLLELLNRENIVVEIMQSLIGSTSILLTIPLTSMICAILYTDKNHIEKQTEETKKPVEIDLKPKGNYYIPKH